jgi:MFS transporter, PAT family, beta-lactamase induction signal transducer AmpG
VKIAGHVKASTGSSVAAWTTVFYVAGATFLLGLLLNLFLLPKPVRDRPLGGTAKVPFLEAFLSFFTQRRILTIIAFILLFRIGEIFVNAVVRLFFHDPVDRGGLNYDLNQMGTIGIIDSLVSIAGQLIGGVMVARFGLKRVVWPFLALMYVPNLFYIYATVHPPSFPVAAFFFGLDYFLYGIATTGFMVFILMVSRNGKFPTAHYAIATGFMGFAVAFFGMWTGKIQVHYGYHAYFVLCVALGLLSAIAIALADYTEKAPEAAPSQ